MRISLITGGDLSPFKKGSAYVSSSKLPPFLGENKPLFKMAYFYIKYGESYDGFKKMVGR